ncbi:surface antigen-domain-containing protein [Geopyxis carbonaria]|nr:surface antigen-domain-containing protein [Geopyxis carbonaria]
MASPLSPEDDVFDRLKSATDPAVISEREKAIQERVRIQVERAQRQLSELIDENSTLPVTISDIRVHGLKNTRHGFLERIVAPALTKNKQDNYTLKSAMEELQKTTDKLHRLGIFSPTINMYLDELSSSSNDRKALSALITVSEKSRFTLKTGTEIGNHEGGGYINATLRNVFGGAESIYGSASTATSGADVGARARSSYEITAAAPVLSNPDTIADIGVFSNSRNNHYYASHEEASKGMRAGLRFLSRYGEHEVGITGAWRQVTNLSTTASASVRADAGDSVKTSITHTITHDFRDNKLLATDGYMLKNTTEVAGAGPLGGDVAFIKSEFEAQQAYPLPYGISVSAGLRGGVLCPLSLGFGDSKQSPKPSRINDRFFLGGTTDIRGFRENGLGPREGQDAVGGDAYMAGGASIYFPLPRLGPESPFRFQAFVNGGRLVAIKSIGDKGGDVQKGVVDAIKEMGIGYPSMAAGVGLVYAHPVARFELNFALPIVKRAEEKSRKGLQFGVGINFL